MVHLHHRHDHGPHLPESEGSAAKRHDRHQARRALQFGLGLTAALAVVELVGGLFSHSLALVGDALHMGTDVAALVVSMLAMMAADRPADERRSFGHQRIEILGSLLSGVVLLLLAAFLVAEAIERLQAPQPVLPIPMLVIAIVGLLANLAVLSRLHGRDHHLGVRAAMLHVLGDTLASVAVVIGALVILGTGWVLIDPVLTILVSVIIVAGTLRLLRDAVDILLESVPRDLATTEIVEALRHIEGVVAVHDLHVWSMSPVERIVSVHVVADTSETPAHDLLLGRIKQVLRDRFGLLHSTVQIQGPSYDDHGEPLHHVGGCC